MSTLPFLLSLADELDSLTNTHSYLDDFGLGFYPHRQYYRTPSIQLSMPANTDWLEERHRTRRTTETKSTSKDGFEVCMDVQQFKPNELTVKTVDNCVVVEGKHEEKEDDQGFISGQFVRRYEFQKGYDHEKVISTLSSDGILTVKAPPISNSWKSNERIIQIHQTGPAHLSVKDNSAAAAGGQEEQEGEEEEDYKQKDE